MRARWLVAVAACGRIGFDPLGSPEGQLVQNVVFIMATTYVPGQLGDLATADSACQARGRRSPLCQGSCRMTLAA